MSSDISPQKAMVIGPGVIVRRSEPRASHVPLTRLQSAWEPNVLSFSKWMV